MSDFSKKFIVRAILCPKTGKLEYYEECKICEFYLGEFENYMRCTYHV